MTCPASSSDLQMLQAIFATRPALTDNILRAVLNAHANVSNACDYLSSMSDEDIPSSQAMLTSTSSSTDAVDNAQVEDAAVENEGLETVIRNLKDIAVPLLCERLNGMPLSLPELQDCGSERLRYSVEQVCVTSFRLQQQNIDIRVQDDIVAVSAHSIDVDVEIGQWSYRTRFPPVSDTGCARLQFRGVRITATLKQIEQTVLLDDCTCKIEGGVSFTTDDSRLSWLYNRVAGVARHALRRAVEQALQNAITQTVEEQLADWTSWVTHIR